MIENEAVFVPVRRVAFRRIGEQVLIVSPDDNVLITLNVTGSLVWERLDGKRSVGDLVTEVAQEFEVTAEQARVDVGTFLAQMVERGLVEAVQR